jgi:hypothetical protein
MTARSPLRKSVSPAGGWRVQKRRAFHPPANDNKPAVPGRLLAWTLVALGFAAMAAVIGAGL